jgi:putrescine aminotransferase
LETIPATLGMPIPPDDFYPHLREICDDKGVLLILDEIQTGLGRTGILWGFEQFGITPDIFAIGKGLSGGIYPILATCYREEIDSFMNEHLFIHISTFGGAELGCPVAMKVLDMVSSIKFLEKVQNAGNQLGDKLASLKEKYSEILTEVRRRGLFIGLKMSDIGYGPVMSIVGYNNGVFAVYADNDHSVLQFLPPLIINEEDITYIIERMDRAYAWARDNPRYLELAKALAV